jgi:hypothetical protein
MRPPPNEKGRPWRGPALSKNHGNANQNSPDRCRNQGLAPIDIRDARFKRDVARLHAHGPRVLHEMLVELAARQLLRTEIERLVGRYAELNPATLDAAGGRGWPA